MSYARHNIEHFLASAFNFFCNPLSPRRRLTTRIWLGAIVTFTISTTVFMLGCVCTDQWEITTYDIKMLNDSIYQNNDQSGFPNDQCTVTQTRLVENGLFIVTSARRKYTPPILSGLDNRSISTTRPPIDFFACQGRTEMNFSFAFRQYGSAFRLCLDVDDSVWKNITQKCSQLDIEKCLYYSPATVKKPFCCTKCLWSPEEVQELDDNGNTTFEPIFTVIGFLIVCLVILCTCHVLALLALWKRLVPVVMFTGILFLVSGTFMAFCLAAHQYKVTIMNSKRRSLPHVTHEMALASTTTMGLSIDAGWMGFAFSVFTGILWIRFSFHLASETTYNKIRPTMALLPNAAINRTTSVAPSNHGTMIDNGGPPAMANGTMGSGLMPKTVRWAVSAGRETSTTTPNSRPDSGGQLLHTDQSKEVGTQAKVANGHVHPKENVELPMMVEDAV